MLFDWYKDAGRGGSSWCTVGQPCSHLSQGRPCIAGSPLPATRSSEPIGRPVSQLSSPALSSHPEEQLADEGGTVRRNDGRWYWSFDRSVGDTSDTETR